MVSEDLVTVAWLFECTAGPYKGEIDVHSLDGKGGSEETRVANFYSAPFPVVRADDANARIIAVEAERDALAKDLAAQIAGHRETARQGTEALMRANTATAKLDEAEGRARKHWQAFCDLRENIIGHGPMCRDCADWDGRCQGSGPPCDPDEAVKEQIANWRASQALAAITPKPS